MTFNDRAADYRSHAAVALAHQRWDEAAMQLEGLTAISPNDPIAWNNLDVALEHQHKNREAVEAYARAAALSPDSLPGRNLVREMQRYLGGAAAFHSLLAHRHRPWFYSSTCGCTAVRVLAIVVLVLGALVAPRRTATTSVTSDSSADVDGQRAEQVQETLPEMRLSEPPLPQAMILTTPDPSGRIVSTVLPPYLDVNESICGADAGGMVMAAVPTSAGNDWLA